jgi:hypothetical protein
MLRNFFLSMAVRASTHPMLGGENFRYLAKFIIIRK